MDVEGLVFVEILSQLLTIFSGQVCRLRRAFEVSGR